MREREGKGRGRGKKGILPSLPLVYHCSPPASTSPALLRFTRRIKIPLPSRLPSTKSIHQSTPQPHTPTLIPINPPHPPSIYPPPINPPPLSPSSPSHHPSTHPSHPPPSNLSPISQLTILGAKTRGREIPMEEGEAKGL